MAEGCITPFDGNLKGYTLRDEGNLQFEGCITLLQGNLEGYTLRAEGAKHSLNEISRDTL